MKKGHSGGIAFDIVNYIILLVLVFITAYPFYYILIYSISDPVEVQKGIGFLPAGFTLDNFMTIFKLKGIANAVLISVLRAVAGTVLTVLCCTFFAYLVTKKELYFRKVIYRFVIVSMYFNAGFIPWYITMKTLGLKNNFLLYILPGSITAFFVILIKTYIEQLPSALEESAKIDGAGYISVFINIIFPLSKPIIATIAIFSAVGQWNAWIDNYFLVQNPKLTTLQLILYNYLNLASDIINKSVKELGEGEQVSRITPTSIKMTMTMVVTIPIILVYPAMQRHFVKGIMLGAIKG